MGRTPATIRGVEKTATDLLAAARGQVKEISIADLRRRQNEDPALLVLDVRERDETEEGTIPGARWLRRGFLELRIESLAARNTPLVLYCAGGARSLLAAATLRAMGYCEVSSLLGGIRAWRQAGHPVERP